MSRVFTIRAGDRLPYLAYDFGISLAEALGIAFYPFAPGDTAAPRKSAMCLFHITWPGNLQESMPSEGYERMVIGENF